MGKRRLIPVVAFAVIGLLWQPVFAGAVAGDVTVGAPKAQAQPAIQPPERIEYFGEDGRFHWRDLPTTVEIETLLPHLKASAGTPVRQDMTSFGPGWGAAAQVFWRPPPPVETPVRNWPNLRLTVPVPHKGRYRVTLVHTVAPDYARVRVFLDGKAVADFDGYAEKVATRTVDLGEHPLDVEGLDLVFSVFGKYTKSTGYCVGLDRVVLNTVE